MITYVGMSMPMAALSLISWLKNPYKGKKSQVEVNRIKKKEVFLLIFITFLVTFVFYYILKEFNTANLIPSTFSVTTSFAAAYLTIRRSPYFALLYAANDVVLLILWGLATASNPSYLSVVICFLVFLAADLYSFINWKRMQKNQNK
jgi:nicotinamide mononucleotide transporter PnuC